MFLWVCCYFLVFIRFESANENALSWIDCWVMAKYIYIYNHWTSDFWKNYHLCRIYTASLSQQARMHWYGIFGRVTAPGTSRVQVRVPYGYKGTQRVPKGKIEI